MAVLFLAQVSLTPSSFGQEATYNSLLEQGYEARRNGDFARAEFLFSQALEARSNDVTALRLIALMVAFQDRLDEARLYIEQAVDIAPDDVDVLISYARILSWQEDFSDAIRITERVIDQVPLYAEAWTLKGRVAYYMQNFDASEDAFETARTLDSENLDALIGLGDVARAQNRTDIANRFYEQALLLQPENKEALQRLSDLEASENKLWRLDVDGEISLLSRTVLSDWYAGTARLEKQITAATQVFGSAALEGRFDRRDFALHTGFASRLSDGFSVYADAGVTLDPDFLYKWQMSGGGTLRITKPNPTLGTGLFSVDMRTRRYDVGTIHTIDVGWLQYSTTGRTWVWGKILNTVDAQDKHLTGWALTARHAFSDAFAVRAGASNAPDSDRGIVVDTHSYTVAVEYEVLDDTFIRFGLERHEREDSYHRHVFRVGAGTRF